MKSNKKGIILYILMIEAFDNRNHFQNSKKILPHVRNAITVRYEEKGQRIWKDFE